MKEVKIEKRDEMLIDQLLIVWKNSVKETHLFLSKDEIENIEPYVFQALNNIKHLIIETDDNGDPIAFMGIEDNKLDIISMEINEAKIAIMFKNIISNEVLEELHKALI